MEVRLPAAAQPRTRPARDTHATPGLRTRARDTRPMVPAPCTARHHNRPQHRAQHAPTLQNTQHATKHSTKQLTASPSSLVRWSDHLHLHLKNAPLRGSKSLWRLQSSTFRNSQWAAYELPYITHRTAPSRDSHTPPRHRCAVISLHTMLARMRLDERSLLRREIRVPVHLPIVDVIHCILCRDGREICVVAQFPSLAF